MKSQKLVPVSSQVDPFEDLEDLDSSLGDSSKDGSSLTGIRSDALCLKT